MSVSSIRDKRAAENGSKQLNERLPFYFSLAILFTAPLYFAAVQPWVWPIYAVAMGLVYLLDCFSGTEAAGAISWRGTAGITVFFCLDPVAVYSIAGFCPADIQLPENWVGGRGGRAWRFVLGWNSISYHPPGITFLVDFSYYAGAFLSSTKKETWASAQFACFHGNGIGVGFFGNRIWHHSGLDSLGGGPLAQHPLCGQCRGTYINRNHFAGFLIMLFPLVLGYALSFGSWEKQTRKRTFRSTVDQVQSSPPLILGVILVCMIVAVLFSKSRAGITGMGVGFITFTILVRMGLGRLPLGFWDGDLFCVRTNLALWFPDRV